MGSDDNQQLTVDPNEVIAELLAIPDARPLWALAQERAARKQLQGQLATAGRRIAELENAHAPTKPPSGTGGHDPVTDPSTLGLEEVEIRSA